MPSPRIENCVVIGTTSKYELRNPIAQYLINQFDASIITLLREVSSLHILEIGCGEGHVTEILLKNTQANITATDLSPTLISETSARIQSARVNFQVADAMHLKIETPRPDMIVCCEVLEHLSDPVKGLASIAAQNAEWYLLSVPREPLWCSLNMLRGRYLRNFGNTPGHLQHWSKSGFLRFVSSKLKVVKVLSPLPWTMVLCKQV
jgi:SAM-dependent methyltransferase